MKNYELIEHTADIGIRVKGSNLKELFINSASAMFDIIAKEPPVSAAGKQVKSQKPEEITIKIKADNLEELFIGWLNELLSISAAKYLIFSHFKIGQLDNTNLKAIVKGSSIKNFRVDSEVKAATYHELKLAQDKSGWQAEVIFDV